MASLDVLDYLQGLDAALTRVPPALRRQALRDARRVIDAMAFRFALMDERPMPEDLDYLRAIEAMKPPARAAPVLERRVPHYRRVRARRLGTTFVILGILGLAVAGMWWLATSEKAEPLGSLSGTASITETRSIEARFNVTPEMDRLYFAGTIFVGAPPEGYPQGNIEIFLTLPSGETRLLEAYSDRATYYLRENILGPAPGEWSLRIDFNGVRGSAQVDVSGISPTR